MSIFYLVIMLQQVVYIFVYLVAVITSVQKKDTDIMIFYKGKSPLLRFLYFLSSCILSLVTRSMTAPIFL